MEPETAEIVVLPPAIPVASPVEEIVATLALLEDQVTLEVRLCVVPSEKVPVAVYCDVAPLAMEVFVGESVSEVRVPDVTVTEVWAVPLS
jgi:hypothetical protein